MIVVRTIIFGNNYYLKRSGSEVIWTGLITNALQFPDETTARQFGYDHIPKSVKWDTVWHKNASKGKHSIA